MIGTVSPIGERCSRTGIALEVPDVERLPLEHEHGLIVHVAATCDRAGGGLTLADEDHRALALFLLRVEMIFAILQLRDAQRDRLGAFARKFLGAIQQDVQKPNCRTTQPLMNS